MTEKRYSVYIEHDNGIKYQIRKPSSFKNAKAYYDKNCTDRFNDAHLTIVEEDHEVKRKLDADKVAKVIRDRMNNLTDNMRFAKERIAEGSQYSDYFQQAKDKDMAVWTNLLCVLHDLGLDE